MKKVKGRKSAPDDDIEDQKTKSSKNKEGETKSKKKSTAVSSSARSHIVIHPAIIYFTHSRVRPYFTGCNKRIEETLEEISSGRTNIEDIPRITVISNEGLFFSLNNRRLFLFKELDKRGLIPKEGIKAFFKPALEREKQRYVPERCSLQAKIMGASHKTNPVESLTGDSTNAFIDDNCDSSDDDFQPSLDPLNLEK